MISILILAGAEGGGQISDGKGQKDRRLTFFHTAAG